MEEEEEEEEVLNEIGSFSDESEKDNDISSDIEIEFLGSDANNEIRSAIQIATVKSTKVTRRKHIVNWKLLENQNVAVCILLIQSVAFQRKLYINLTVLPSEAVVFEFMNYLLPLQAK
jgi:hypothetical protein